MFCFNNKGQSFLEGFIIACIITVLMFAALQICIMVADDMYLNYSAFSAARKIVVSKSKDISDTAKQTVSKLLTPYMLNSKSIFNYKTTHWNEEILGNKILDHSDKQIHKHNIKIGYYIKIMFGRFFNSSYYREQSARARMIKSPDENFYNKAYPDAKEFPKYEQ
ncbi:MAG: hypothetical protein K5622_06230 [Endomicrobiaceae bacterium]|nr:hypothetical protein [Endomicrobiaceae bacterium]